MEPKIIHCKPETLWLDVNGTSLGIEDLFEAAADAGYLELDRVPAGVIFKFVGVHLHPGLVSWEVCLP